MRKHSRDERRQSPSAILATHRTDEGRQLDLRRVPLTEGTIVLSEVLDTAARPSDDVRRLAHINAALETGIENPLDAAIVAAGEAAGLTKVGLTKIDEIPYDFVRRRLTIVVSEAADPGHHQIVTKGAFAEVLDSCTAFECDGAEAPLDEAASANLETVFTAKGAEGYRVLALATRRVAAKSDYDRGDERDMVFRGFLVFLDAREKMETWRRFYNEDRPRSAIGYKLPITLANLDGASGSPS